MPVIPEAILRKLIVKNSLANTTEGFTFQIKNSLSPVTVHGFSIQVGANEVPPNSVSIQVDEMPARTGTSIKPDNPLVLSLGAKLAVVVSGIKTGTENIRLTINTREAGALSFHINSDDSTRHSDKLKTFPLVNFIVGPIKGETTIEFSDAIGDINPNIYGQFVEHLERCVYGGIWNEDGSELRWDTVGLIKDIKPPIIRYPGGNFASDYHWEDGIGPRQQRPERFNNGWNASESNQVGTDEFISFCREVGAEPFLVVNDGSGTPEEAARWVAYCNEPATGEQGKRRAANGHPEPYAVKKWGIGNEAWGTWQVGHTDARGYAARLRTFAEAMRNVDPEIQLVAVGNTIEKDMASDPGRIWNDAVLQQAGDLIDELSFHLYQPGYEAWQDSYDQDQLFKTVCAAPLDVEEHIKRISRQTGANPHNRKVTVALDEWNLWLPPVKDAASQHQVRYTVRDALYAAGVLNVFQRQCKSLTTANLAQLVNILPLIETTEDKTLTTALYQVFKIYSQMEKVALKATVKSPKFSSQALGNISAHENVPYLDVAAARSRNGQRLTVVLVNRHPSRRMYLDLNLKGFGMMQATHGLLLSSKDALAYNTFENPKAVSVKELKMPDTPKIKFRLDLHQASIAMMVLRKGV